jgi:hypothetical protein
MWRKVCDITNVTEIVWHNYCDKKSMTEGKWLKEFGMINVAGSDYYKERDINSVADETKRVWQKECEM